MYTVNWSRKHINHKHEDLQVLVLFITFLLVLSVTQLWKFVQVIVAQIFKWHLGTSINTYLKFGASPLSMLCPCKECTAWWPQGKASMTVKSAEI